MKEGGARVETNGRSRISRFLFEKLDKSVIVNFIIRLRKSFLSLKTKVVGAFFTSLGAYAVIKGLIDFFIGNVDFTSSFYCGLVVFFASLPMLYYDAPLLSFFKSSKLGGMISAMTGAREEQTKVQSPRGITAIGFIIGALLGYFNIFMTLKVLGLLLVASLIFTHPIQGYFLILLAISFSAGENVLVPLMVVTFVSVVLKLLRLKLTLTDFAIEIGLLLMPLALYELAMSIIKGTSLVYLMATLLCFFAPAVFNKGRKVQNGLKFLIYPTVIVSFLKLLAFALGYVSNRFSIHTFGISFDAFSRSDTSEIFLYLVSFVLLVCFAVSRNKPYKKFFAIVACVVLAASSYFTYSFELSVRHSFVYSLVKRTEIIPIIIVSAFCVFAVVLSILRYNRLLAGRDISIRTKRVFDKYDFHHYVLSVALIIALSYSCAVLLPYSDNMFVVCFFIMGLFSSLASDFTAEAEKAVSSSFDKQDSLTSSIDIQ